MVRNRARPIHASNVTTSLWWQEDIKPLTKWQWDAVVEKKAHRGRLWNVMGKEQYIREMWEHFCKERARVQRFRQETEEEKASRNTGPAAAGIASQRVLGASEVLH